MTNSSSILVYGENADAVRARLEEAARASHSDGGEHRVGHATGVQWRKFRPLVDPLCEWTRDSVPMADVRNEMGGRRARMIKRRARNPRASDEADWQRLCDMDVLVVTHDALADLCGNDVSNGGRNDLLALDGVLCCVRNNPAPFGGMCIVAEHRSVGSGATESLLARLERMPAFGGAGQIVAV
jgi:hypothetical protein